MSSEESLSSSPAADRNPYCALPSVNELAAATAREKCAKRLPRELIVAAVRQVLAQCRQEITSGNRQCACSDIDELVKRVEAHLDQAERTALDEVINGTGILIHTGLGRAPLSSRALGAIVRAAAGYTALEINLASGERGQRANLVRDRLCDLTGAESATVVNNNAAALLITLATLATGKEVIVSRGELIEIGGSFRLPEVMAASGATLCEVGTTNKTRLSDFAGAIGEATGAILKVHPSNYQITGFTEAVAIDQLVALARTHHLPVVHDIGSGALVDLAALGLGNEPVARTSVEAGADLVLFSGDKLLGGPQAGLIVGRRKYVEQIERHPLMRALRVDKLTLAALSATLVALAHPRQAARELPLWTMAAASLEDLEQRARRMVDALKMPSTGFRLEVVPTTAYWGGGALPSQGIASIALALTSEECSEGALAQRLRGGSPAVVGRLQGGRLLVDLRTVLPDQDEVLVAAIQAAAQN
ncbi:MAG: L-seryl-tRNA(Sec) selenium transferase [Planctomycetia bacterium]|nr:L-seryl-tRNA(Sec) selenium transferase [Planctomycetia bacterium]